MIYFRYIHDQSTFVLIRHVKFQKVRALVGLCKLGASGGSDASLRPLAEGSTTKLAEACRRFLINAQKDFDLRRWAAEGLSFLTMDAEVKEKLVEDEAAIR